MNSAKSILVFLATLLFIIFTLLTLTTGLDGSVAIDSSNSDINVLSGKMNIEKEKESTSLPSKQSSQVVISPPSSSPPPKTDTDMTYDDLVSRYILKHNRNPPPGFESWFKSAKLNKCFLDRYDGIYRDLAPFVGLSGKEFTHRLKLATKARSTTTVVIKNGEASVYHPLIANIAKDLPDMTVTLNGLDEPRVLFNVHQNHNPNISFQEESHLFYSPPRGQHATYMQQYCPLYAKTRPFERMNEKHGFLIEPASASYTRFLIPMLSQTRVDPCFGDIVTPSTYYFGAAEKGGKGKAIPWTDKQSNLFWRGSTTGGFATRGNYKSFHRQRLMSFATKNSTLFDVAFTAAIQCDDPDCTDMQNSYPFKPRSALDENFKHKYLLDIDGNTFSGRFVPFLHSGSLVFKATVFTEYFRDWLQPFVHFVPVELDLSDLEDKVKWALEHDREARQIALNGQKFAEEHLSDGQMGCYMHLLLIEMARLGAS